VRDFVIPLAVGLGVAGPWLAICVIVMRAFGIPYWMLTAEQWAARTQRLLRLGKWRYVFTFGVLCHGFAMGLGISTAVATMPRTHLSTAIVLFGVIALLSGCMSGVRTWNELFRAEGAFPALYPPFK
jgi:hypothetical protein